MDEDVRDDVFTLAEAIRGFGLGFVVVRFPPFRRGMA